MDASLVSRLQSQQIAAAHVVGTSLLPKSGGRSTMMTANGALPVATGMAKATSADTGSTAGSSGSSTTAAGATITSSDFLSLLVAELQNQDPTQPTDPNEYISQLTEVNSLEQLIQINSGISTLDSSISTPSSGATGSLVPAASASPIQQSKTNTTNGA